MEKGIRGKPLSLTSLNLRQRYRSDRQDLLSDFYIPCLRQSVSYDRAVGFFSSSSLVVAAQGLSEFVKAGGKMRLVASPRLSEADIRAIEQGLQQREIITKAVVRELTQPFDQIVRDRLACLAWLLAQGLLEIRLAVHRVGRGYYHEKLGVFTDALGNQIVFSGSANESANALRDNFECIDLFCSWCEADAVRLSQKVTDFEQLWQNQTPNLEIIEFPEAAKRLLLERCPDAPPTQEPRVCNPAGEYAVSTAPAGIPVIPSDLTLRPYQQQAIMNWFVNKGRGTLKMATGSGKTITALALAAELYRKSTAKGQPLKALLILCPYRHLVTQWAETARRFGLRPILAFEAAQSWQGELQSQLLAVHAGRQAFVTVITTNATLMRDSLQSQLQFFPQMSLIVGDEAHNLGATRLEASLPQSIPLRLALSATPERYFDESGTERLFEYFGSVLAPEFTLKDAISAGALVPYLYQPILVELTEAETEQYAALTSQIGRIIGMTGTISENERLTALLMQRARLVGAAENKLAVLKTLMQSRLQTSHTLFYCGDGSVEDSISETSLRQLTAVTSLLQSLGYRVQSYTAETSLAEREDLRYQFAEGILPGLVAIRCLDEGVDIPAIHTAVILASSSNPRQFIQRRGRILRPSPGKTRAELFDLIVVPPDLGAEFWAIEQKLLRQELKRFVEFADLAINSGSARRILLPLQEKYRLLDL